jgi:hypothetical protein
MFNYLFSGLHVAWRERCILPFVCEGFFFLKFFFGVFQHGRRRAGWTVIRYQRLGMVPSSLSLTAINWACPKLFVKNASAIRLYRGARAPTSFTSQIYAQEPFINRDGTRHSCITRNVTRRKFALVEGNKDRISNRSRSISSSCSCRVLPRKSSSDNS